MSDVRPSDISMSSGVAKRVWFSLVDEYRTRVLPKDKSLLMWFIGLFLSVFKFMPLDTFRSRYTTTIADRIYTPYKVGEGDAIRDPDVFWRQIKLGVHEHTHILQYRSIGYLLFAYRYATSTRARAMYEAEAYATGIEMDLWRTSGAAIIDTGALAARLVAYGCKPSDIESAKALYDIAYARLRGAKKWKDPVLPARLSPVALLTIKTILTSHS